MALETKNATETGRRLVPLTRLTRGRAIASRSVRSPIATITDRKTIQRAVISLGVTAVSEVEGITNRGAGPSFGPTPKGKAPRTRWPSNEIAPQETRDQPFPEDSTGT